MGNGIPEIRLTVFKGDEQVGDHQFAQPVVVLGRGASADLVVPDNAVLPLHAEIRVDSAGGLSIADLGTAGGTWVNRERIVLARLSPGDEIIVGNTRLMVELLHADYASRFVVDGGPQPDPRSSLDRILAELESEGQVDSAGHFSIDREKARDKMAEFLLADPTSYVLEITRAATLYGATAIRFEIDADDMRMSFDGPPISPAILENPWNAVFVDRVDTKTEANRQFALGLNGALATSPRFIRVRTGNGKRGTELEMRPGRDPVLTDPEAERVVSGTRIHIKSRVRAETVVNFLKDAAFKHPQEIIIHEHCRYSSLPIDVEGRKASHGLAIPGGAGVVEIKGPSVKGVAGFLEKLDRRSAVHWLKNGILVVSHQVRANPPGFVAAVEGEGLKTDLSLREIVRNEQYESGIQVLAGAHRRSLDVLCDEVERVPESRWAVQRLREAIQLYPSREAFRAKVPDPLAMRLSRVPLWDLAAVTTGEWNAVWASGPNDVYLAGRNGLVLHHNGTWFRPVQAPTKRHIHAVWGNAPSSVFFAGQRGTMLYFDGHSLFRTKQITRQDLNAVWGVSPDNVFVVGNKGTILKWTGATWLRQSANVPTNLHGVWGSSKSDVYAVGDNSTILHFDGKNWTDVGYKPADLLFRRSADFTCVWGTGPDNVFVGGHPSQLVHFDGKRWHNLTAKWSYTEKRRYHLRGIWGSDPSNIFAVGDHGAMLRLQDDKWQPVPDNHLHDLTTTKTNEFLPELSSVFKPSLNGIWGTGPNDAYTVGRNGSVLHFNGHCWMRPRISLEQILQHVESGRGVPCVLRDGWQAATEYFGKWVRRRLDPCLQFTDRKDPPFMAKVIGKRLEGWSGSWTIPHSPISGYEVLKSGRDLRNR